MNPSRTYAPARLRPAVPTPRPSWRSSARKRTSASTRRAAGVSVSWDVEETTPAVTSNTVAIMTLTLAAAVRDGKRCRGPARRLRFPGPMFAPETFASAFARTLDLFRDPAAKEEQKTQFRALLALLHGEAATIATDGGRLSINGTRLEGGNEDYTWLVQRLE